MTTLGERVEDTFLIDGSALQQNRMQLQIETEMLDAIAAGVTLVRITAAEAIAELDRFDTVIDARSEGEFAEDRLPGAVNWPSLHDEERALVGTEYKQVAPFDAKKRGAAMVAKNIAAHLERHVLDKPRDWTPLVYCWRGGKRSGALATVLDQIGFRVHVLEGGYRDFRRAVVTAIEAMPATLDWRVVCGPTGSGKSRLLHELAASGAQVLDLESLANHRGSVLGLVPGSTQPAQKAFDPRSGTRCGTWIPRGPSSSRAKARRSATCACPRR